MKKLLKIFLYTAAVLLSISSVAYANADENFPSEIYGLLSVSKVMSFEENFDYGKSVDAKSYADIMNFYFGEGFWADKIPSNSDAVNDLADFAPKISQSKYKLSSFKDFGFIKKEHRRAYAVMCDAGYLSCNNDILSPNAPLSYEYFFSLLKNFNSFAAISNNFDIYEGAVTDVYSDKNNITIKQSTNGGIKEYTFNKMHSFYVCNGESIAPYSFNIKRGQNVRVYTADGIIIYISIAKTADVLNGDAEINEASIYICNEYDSELVFKNKLTGSYIKLPYDTDLMVYEGTKKHPISEINNTLLDRNCYYITDTASGKIKYINITG